MHQLLKTEPSQAPPGGGIYTKHWFRLALLAAVLAAGLLAVAWRRELDVNFGGTHLDANLFLFIHIITESASIVVSFSVFTIAWYTYRQSSSNRDLFISLTFLLVGIVDFAHTLSYPGMPPFLAANSVSRASTYWIFARLFAVSGLLAAAFIPRFGRRVWLTPQVLLPTALASAFGLIAVELLRPGWIPAMFVPGQGQTPLKVGLEYGVIGLNLVAIVAYERLRRAGQRDLVYLQAALVAGIFSEMAFASYFSAYDAFSLLGHFYKILAYYLILKGLFVSSVRRPYEHLETARRDAERSREDLEHSFSLIGAALGIRVKPEEVLQLILRLASDALHAPRALIALRNEQSGPGALKVVATLGIAGPFPDISLDGSLAGEVVRDKTPRRMGDLDEHSRVYRPAIADGTVRSVLCVPILRGDECVGALEIFSETPDAFGQPEAERLFAFSRQAGIALENAYLFEEIQRSARIAMLRAAELDTVIEQMAEGVAIIDRDRRITRLNRMARELLGIPAASPGTSYDLQSLPALFTPEGKLVPREDLPIMRAMGGEIGVRRELFTSSDPETARVLAVSAAPLMEPGSRLITGVVALIRDVTEQRRAHERERRIAETYQKSLLPQELPEVGGFDIQKLYRAAWKESDVGGDFYDALELGDGQLGLVIADVSGKGLNAAVYTAMGKYMLRAYAAQEGSPSEVMRRLNAAVCRELAGHDEMSVFITLIYGILDRETGEFRYASAGHEPGLLMDGTTGEFRTLDSTGPPLGILPEISFGEKTVSLRPGDTLALYTDGVTDSRQESDSEPRFLELNGLKGILSGLRGRGASEICEGIYTGALEFSQGSQRDDIALLVVQATPAR